MIYHVIVKGKLYKISVKNAKPVIEEKGSALYLSVPYVILGDAPSVPEDFREMIKYFCSRNQPVFPASEGFLYAPLKDWKADKEELLRRKAAAEQIAETLSISDDYHTRINGYFVHTITPDYLILKKDRLIPVFIGNQEGDIREIHKDRIVGSFLNGEIQYERLTKEFGITLVAY